MTEDSVARRDTPSNNREMGSSTFGGLLSWPLPCYLDSRHRPVLLISLMLAGFAIGYRLFFFSKKKEATADHSELMIFFSSTLKLYEAN